MEEHSKRQWVRSVPRLDSSLIAALYHEFGDEDRKLAEEGVADYERGLRLEDAVKGEYAEVQYAEPQ